MAIGDESFCTVSYLTLGRLLDGFRSLSKFDVSAVLTKPKLWQSGCVSGELYYD
jgi:hypothetical protein